MKETKRPKIEHIVITTLAVVIVVLIAAFINFGRRSNIIAHDLTVAHELIGEMMLENMVLEIAYELLSARLQEERPDEDATNDFHYRLIRRILDEAPARLREVFDEDVILDEPENFVFLPRDRILISGRWVCTRTDTPHTMDAIFYFWQIDDDIRISLLSYSPYGWGDWRDP